MPMVPAFLCFLGFARSWLQPQSYMHAHAQLRAQWFGQWNLVQWKHAGSITAPSSTGLLCTQACSYPTKDSDRAVCYSLATSPLDHTVLSSISLSSPIWIKSIKSLVRSSERVAGICRSVWSFVSDSMFGLGYDLIYY